MSGYHGPPQRRYPAERLRAILGSETDSDFARRCKVERSQMRRYLRDGMPEMTADRIAVRVGLHPAEVWPEWFGGAA